MDKLFKNLKDIGFSILEIYKLDGKTLFYFNIFKIINDEHIIYHYYSENESLYYMINNDKAESVEGNKIINNFILDKYKSEFRKVKVKKILL